MMHGYGLMHGYGILGGYGYIIFILLFLIIAYALYKIFSNNNNERAVNNQSLEILKTKYVQGEISEEEYLRKKEVLKNN